MRALSFSQPWLWAILHAGKHVENRSWAPPIEMIDQRIALHAAKSFDDKVWGRFTPIGQLVELGFSPPMRYDLYPKSVIVGTAIIDRVVTESRTIPEDQKRWFFGPIGWILREVTLIDPVPATGKQGLWTMSLDLEKVVMNLHSAAVAHVSG